MWLELHTRPPLAFHNQDQLVATFTINGDSVQAFRSDDPDVASAYFEFYWTHDGVNYAMSVNNLDFFDRIARDPAGYVHLVADVRYAEPAASAPSPSNKG